MLQQMLKELLQAEKKGPIQEARKLQMEKLTSKDKHTLEVGNHPHTKLEERVKDKSSQLICIHSK